MPNWTNTWSPYDSSGLPNTTRPYPGLLPIGTVVMWPGTHVPPGWLPCDGRELPRNIHPELFAVLGVTYGAPTDKTFRLPNTGSYVVQSATSSTTVGSTQSLTLGLGAGNIQMMCFRLIILVQPVE